MKRRPGDRKDGTLLRNLDSLHFITPILYPNRCDNEAFISERIDLTKTLEYLERRNGENPEYRYKLFQIILAAVLKTITLKPKLNRFIAKRNFYQRNELTASFVVKKEFSDNGGEALAFLHASPEDTLDSIHAKIFRRISDCRGDTVDDSTAAMDIFNKMPRFLSKAIVRFICFLDRHGLVPASLIASDPYYSSVVLTNLGSIKLHSGYHHLTNWGTNSVFVAIGEQKKRPFFSDDGTFTMRESIDLGLTIDERLADGFYYSGAMALLKKLIENPELLELPLEEEI